MNEALIGLLGILIGVAGTLVVQRYVIRQKTHELFLTSLTHLGGGSQERNLGISALEFYWDEYESEQKLIVPLLVGAAIYLLTESKQGDSQHERYNLKRIMRLLLVTYKLGPSASKDSATMDCFRDLHQALCDWDPKGREITVKKETFTRGLLVEDKLITAWKRDLEEKFPTLKYETE